MEPFQKKEEVMRKVLCIFLVVLFIVVLWGCSARTSAPSASIAKDMVNKLTYVQDSRTDICYAVVGFARPGDLSNNSAGITYVPCEKVPAGMLVK